MSNIEINTGETIWVFGDFYCGGDDYVDPSNLELSSHVVNCVVEGNVICGAHSFSQSMVFKTKDAAIDAFIEKLEIIRYS
jgi:hypothetical protein